MLKQEHFNYIIKVIKSCKTNEQIINAINWARDIILSRVKETSKKAEMIRNIEEVYNDKMLEILNIN